MFLYPDPKTINIAGVKIGGQPGENPPVLIGTIFYEKHKILTANGFDKKGAENLINKQVESSEETKIPSIVNVFGNDIDNFKKRIAGSKKLRVKFGIDPTGPDIHLGHTVQLWKLRQFLLLHQII